MTASARAAVLCLAAALAGCLGASTTTCSDGTTCPAATVCAPTGGACVAPEAIAACVGHAAGASCVADGLGAGSICADQVCSATSWTATVTVGAGAMPTSIGLAAPTAVAVDADGNLYVADSLHDQVRRIDATGAVTTLAGTGTAGSGGDGGAATNAELDDPVALAVDGLGDLYITDFNSNRIRRVDATTGIITTVAGSLTSSMLGDDGPAVDAKLFAPHGIAVDGLGNLYIADTGNSRIRFVDVTTGIITTVAGNGTPGSLGGDLGDGKLAVAANVPQPIGVAVDAQGDIYIADAQSQTVRVVSGPTGIISTVAGTNAIIGSAGDGGPATSATFHTPLAIVVDGVGDFYVADAGNNRVRKIDAAGVITTVAGDGTAGSSGDGGAATAAQLDLPSGLALDVRGSLDIADTSNERIRQVAAGSITTIVGNGTATSSGGAATATALHGPQSVAIDTLGGFVIADTANDRILQVDPTGVVASLAGGGGVAGFGGDGAAATDALLDGPDAVTVDASGNVYIADTGNARIRRVDRATGVITTIAGIGGGGESGDGGPATAAQLANPQGVAVDGAGNVYVADTGNNRVRRIDAASGVITTIAGTGVRAEGGDGGPAIAALLDAPVGIAVDRTGTLYVSDMFGNRVRAVDAAGTIKTIAGDGIAAFAGDGSPAASAEVSSPAGLAIDGSGNLYIADTGNNRIRRVDPAGVITTIAGGGPATDGDGGPATSATLAGPFAVAVDPAGRLYVADNAAGHIRQVDPAGRITTVAGAIDPQGMGPIAEARFADARALAVGPAFTLVAGGSSGTVQALRAATMSVGVVIGRDGNQPSSTGSLARFQAGSFGDVASVAYDDAARVIYLTESSTHRIDEVTVVDPSDETTWTLATLAGGTAGFADGTAAVARFRDPTGLYLDAVAQVLYVADTGNQVIRAIDLADGATSVIAGTPEQLGLFGDHGLATSALLYLPQAITKCGNGDLFIADTGNSRVRRIEATTGTITTVLGDGSLSSSGDGAPATDFPVEDPLGLACDAAGDVFVTSTATVRMLIADATGMVDGSGPVRTIYGAQPRAALPASVTRCLTGVAVVDPATVQVVDSCTGILVTLARVTGS